MGLTLGSLAVRHGCELHGDPDAVVDRVGTLGGAQPGALTFLANPHYRPKLAQTKASAVVLAQEDAAACPVACLVAMNPYLTYARIAAELHPPPPLQPGIASGAWIDPAAVIGAGSQVEHGAVVGARARLGERVYIGPGVSVGADCSIGDDSRLMAGVSLYDRVRIGRRGLLHAGVVIGADGFGIARDSTGAWIKVPQVGTVLIGDDVEIGANTSIDRGAIEDTVIGDGVKLDNQIQIGHNVTIGAHTAIAALTGISGSTTIGSRCIIGGHCGFAGHITIADDVVITGGAKVTNSIRRPGLYGGVLPADEARRWRKNAVRFGQLDELVRRVQQIETSTGKGRGKRK